MEFLSISEIIRTRLHMHAAAKPAPERRPDEEHKPETAAPRSRRRERGPAPERVTVSERSFAAPAAPPPERARRVEPEAAPIPEPAAAPAVDLAASAEARAASARLERGQGYLPEGFAKLGIGEPLLRALRHIGFESPSEIQEQGIPVALTGKDMVGQAKTGTGKTACFGLPILQRIVRGEIKTAIVLAPTRELALQVRDEIEKYARYSNIRAAAIYGGVPLEGQRKSIRDGAQVFVGTPGRVLDMAQRGWLDLGSIDVVVLDECDRMFDLGFRPDIERIMKQMRSMKQLLLFSATINSDVDRLTERFSKDPVRVSVVPEKLTVDQVEQHCYQVTREKKIDMLAELVRRLDPPQALVFVRTKIGCEKIAKRLNDRGVKAAELHGDLRQERREKILQRFRDSEIKLLVATDVAARGLDIPTISHVFNYDIPEYAEDYVHRIGRTARMGAKGVAITLIEPGQGGFLTEIEKLTNVLVDEEKLEGFDPGTAQVEAAKKPKATGTGTVLFSTWSGG